MDSIGIFTLRLPPQVERLIVKLKQFILVQSWFLELHLRFVATLLCLCESVSGAFSVFTRFAMVFFAYVELSCDSVGRKVMLFG